MANFFDPRSRSIRKGYDREEEKKNGDVVASQLPERRPTATPMLVPKYEYHLLYIVLLYPIIITDTNN